MPKFHITGRQNPQINGEMRFGIEGGNESAFVVDALGNLTLAGAFTANGITDAVNAKVQGATGGGVVDDTVALNAAITLAAATSGFLYIPAGTYKISGPLVLASNLVIQGAGRGKTIISQSSTTSDALANTATGLVNICLQDLDVRGPASGSGMGIRIGANTAASNYMALNRLNVQSFGSHNVYLGRCIISTVANVRSQGAGGHAFYFDRGTSIDVRACYALSAAQAGYYVGANATYLAFQGCGADSCGVGYYLDTCNNVSLSGCGSEGMINQGVSYPGVGFYLNAGGRHTLTSCYTFGNPNIAFQVTGNSTKNVLLAPQEASPSGSPTASIQVDSGSRATIIGPQNTTALNLVGRCNVFDYGAANMGVGVGVGTSLTSGAIFQVNDDGTNGGFLVQSTAIGTASSAPFRVFTSDPTKRLLDFRVTGDAVSRVRLDNTSGGAGRLTFGDGTTAGVNVYQASSGVLATDNDFRIAAIGKGLQVGQGTNAKIGKATLVAGTVVVANTSVTANSIILLTGQNASGTAGAVGVSARTAGTSFTITSTSGTDTRDIGYLIVEPI